MKQNNAKKVIVILGPTASGKTKLGVDLANKFHGEIISADSRQVFRGMDIGTGKDLQEYGQTPYHLIDVVDPNTEFDLMKYKQLANEAIEDICARKKIPLVVGGTGFYIQSLAEDTELSSVKPNKEFREEMEKLSVEELFEKLTNLKLEFAEKLNNSERNNKRRLIRYVEIAKENAVDLLVEEKTVIKKTSNVEYLIMGITWPRAVIQERIYKRLLVRLEKEGMIDEVKKLHDEENVSWKRLESFGLEYKYIAKYLKEELTYDEMVERLNIAIRQFAKKQMSWFRRWEKQGMKIYWINKENEAENLVKEFLNI